MKHTGFFVSLLCLFFRQYGFGQTEKVVARDPIVAQSPDKRVQLFQKNYFLDHNDSQRLEAFSAIWMLVDKAGALDSILIY
jgi:hypothetical protein